MGTHYNAFISYKHAELDNKIAALVERSLEHYHIPRKIRKKTGINKIERIFRDTDELPITSDLSGTIAEAIENADYLIVICSTNTCRSMWVEREIKLFLQNHTQDQILTVLADGEPADVVPEILKNKEITRVNEEGVEETITISVEPLSCDFRLPKKEAINTELPRLVASIVGCKYNELMDRQRQYKMKRLTAVFAGVMAVALGFSGYMLYSRNQINESYRASLISQSKYLANESEKLLDNANRVDALHLALKALPCEEMPDRPVTTEAVSAITRATMAYTPKDAANMEAVWNYEMPGNVKKMAMSPDETFFSALDKEGNIKVWELKNNTLLMEYNPLNSFMVPKNFEYLSNGNMIVVGDFFVACLDLGKVEVVWENDYPYECLADRNINITSDGNILITMDNGKFRECSFKDGKLVSEYKLPSEITDIMIDSVGIGDTTLSCDNSKIAFSVYNTEGKYGIGVYDIVSGETVFKDLNADLITGISFSTTDNLIVAYDIDAWESNAIFLNFTRTKKDYDKIICYDPTDLSEKWEKDYLNTNVAYNTDLIYINKNDSIAYYSGDRSEVWDISTGETLRDYIFAAPIVDALFDEETEQLRYVTADGGLAANDIFDIENEDTVNSGSLFVGDIGNVFLGEDVFINQRNSNSIIRYSWDFFDPDWTSFENAPEMIDSFSPYCSYLDENVAAVIYEEGESVMMDLYDPNLKKYTKKVELSDSDDHDINFGVLGTYEGKLLLSYSKMGLLGLISVDYSTGDFTVDKINKYNFSYMNFTNFVKYENGKIAFAEVDSEEIIVTLYDVSSKNTDEYRIPYDGYFGEGGIYYFEKQGFIYFAGNKDYIIDIKKNDIKAVSYSQTWDGTVCVSMNDDGTLIATSDGVDIIINDVNTIGEADIKATIPLLSLKTHKPVFYKEKGSKTEMLLVPYTNGSLCRYNASTGELIGETGFYASVDPDYNSTITFDPKHSCIYLHYVNLTSIIDIDSYKEIGFMYRTIGYHEPSDTFICVSEDENGARRLGYFRHYTLDDLIKKATDILQNHEMPQEKRDAYGIG